MSLRSPSEGLRARDGRKDLLVSTILGLTYVVLLLSTVADLGYARDEGFYFHSARAYQAWFSQLAEDPSSALERSAVDRAFRVNHEHPVLIKSLFAWSHRWLFERFGLFDMEGTGFRFPAMALAGLAVALTYRWTARKHGHLAGLFAAVLLAAMPRFFYHAHLACFDVPIAAMWLLCAYCYARSLERGILWSLLTGLVFGLALNTKHNAWFLPIACLTHVVLMLGWTWWTRTPLSKTPQIRRGALTLLCMLSLGPLVVFVTWPWLWHDTTARLSEYVSFHWHHDYYNMEFLGQNYWAPPMPRSYAWLMTAATVPGITLLLFASGLGAWLRQVLRALRRRTSGAVPELSDQAMWLLGIGVAFGPWLSDQTPIFGGTKHWMTAYPFVAMFAGAAAARIVSLVRAWLRTRGGPWVRRVRGHLVPALVGAALLSSPVVQTTHSHPWGLSAYAPLVGGSAGAATLGLNRTFWGYTTGSTVDYLNTSVPPGGTVYVHDTAWPAWDMLLRDGRLRADIRGVGSVAEADFALYHHEQHMQGQEYQAWVALGTTAPDFVAGLDGVPVVWVYRRAE